MDDRRVADYFVVAGLPDNPELLADTTLSESTHLKSTHSQAPITDIGVLFPTLEGEKLPIGYEIIKCTPTGLSADLNHGSLRSTECYICYRRGRDKPPLVDIGVMYDGKEWLMPDAELVDKSFGGHVANVNNSSSITYLTYRRGNPSMPRNALVVTDICVVIASKGESPPHAFCCINKNLNKGITGSDVFLCYKKSMNRAQLLTYKPAVLSRYPMGDVPSFPFPNSVALFCLPMGASLEMWPSEAAQPKPVFSTFVLTVSDAKQKVYGSAVTFYEFYPEEKVTLEQRELLGYDDDSNNKLHANKSICLLSHWPFSDTFEKWLHFLYRIVSGGSPQTIPVERYIIQLLDEVPFPGPRTLLQLSPNDEDRVILMQPEDLPLPRSAAGFRQLLINLGSENSLQVLLLALTEQKILIHSLRPDTLTAVAEAVSSFLFPFKWQCPYIPLCPLELVEVLHAPLPFLIGVDSRFFDLYDPPPDVSCIDLDTNIITVAETQKQLLNVKLLPKRAAKHLKTALEYLYFQLRNAPANQETHDQQVDFESEFRQKKKEQIQELEIQEAFLKFMALTLKGYRSYLLPITKAPTVGTTDPQALFQLNEFLKSRDKAHHKFFSLLMRTQMFIRFIEERSFVADGDQGLAFFDDCTERLSPEEGEVKLLDIDTGQTSERTVFLLPPEPPSQGGDFTYSRFALDPSLLAPKRRTYAKSLFESNVLPGSPMARRTKHEIKSAQKLARKCAGSPELWARCLSGTCYTLYFMTLPGLLSLNVGKEKAILQQSYELLVKATQQRLTCDEVCYRLMMQLCGEHSKPLLAVKLLLHMKRSGIQPNALTYGLYNRCVLEAEWPAHASSSQLLWNKLRCVVLGAAHFRWAAKKRAARRLSVSTEGGSSLLEAGGRAASHSSLDSHETVQGEWNVLDKLRTKVTSIVRGSSGAVAASNGDLLDSADVAEEEEFGQTVDGVADDGTDKSGTNINSFTPPESPSEYRILSRLESAGDANLIDILEQNARKTNCTRSLCYNGESTSEDNALRSPGKATPRTLVTENDPLGALEQPPVSVTPPSTSPVPLDSSSQSQILTDDPVLFRSSVQRSATFENSPPAANKIHRSETVPAATVASSLASLGSTLKIGFSRYSPSRMSLRKADLKVPQQFIENAITNLSPSSLTGKKSNELIQGGLSSLKAAANTMAKKLDEIKEKISTSTNTTPVKVMNSSDRLAAGDMATENAGEGESTDGSEVGERQRKISAELPSCRGSYTNLKDHDEPLPESLFPPPTDDIAVPDIILTSCSQCHNCSSLLYDEDIMSNWVAEDSNLNTICTSCNKPTVPLLTVTLTGSSQRMKPSEPFSVPYLNPLVLRKELENILAQEGDLSLAESKFIDEHPIIYWNLVWCFERISVQTHLPNLCLKRNTSNKSALIVDESHLESTEDDGSNYSGNMQPVEQGADPLTQEIANLEHLEVPVRVKCVWDDPQLHTDGPPMYMLWQKRDTSSVNFNLKSLMHGVVSSVYTSDLEGPLKKLAAERQQLGDENCGMPSTYSIYREMLFLSCRAIGRANIDLNEFDKVYALAYSRATERNIKLYSTRDKALSISALFCRQYFRPLSLL